MRPRPRPETASVTPIYDALYAEFSRLFRTLPGDRTGEEEVHFRGFQPRPAAVPDREPGWGHHRAHWSTAPTWSPPPPPPPVPQQHQTGHPGYAYQQSAYYPAPPPPPAPHAPYEYRPHPQGTMLSLPPGRS